MTDSGVGVAPAVAVVGYGQWGRNLARNFAALGALRAICDRDLRALEAGREAYPGMQVASDLGDVLRDPDVRACAIAAPAAQHYDLAREALLADKDVLVEKPLALRVTEGRDLARLAEERGRVLMVGHVFLYHPAIVRLKELVDQGVIGKIQYVYSTRLNLGKFRTEENILWSFAPHDFSIILWLLGEMPTSVVAHGGGYLNSTVPDVTVTALSFASGVRGHIFVSWLHPYKELRLVVIGDRAMAAFDGLSPERKLVVYEHRVDWVNRLPVARSTEPQPIAVEDAEPLRRECEHFLACVRSRSRPLSDGESGVRVLEVLEWCQQSLDKQVQHPGVPTLEGGSCFVHSTAVVERPCEIGAGTKIWYFSHVMRHARIGTGCTLGQNVFVDSRVEIGNNVKIQNNVAIYEGVVLEDDVFCGPSVVFTNVINPRSRVPRRREIRRTIVRRGATIGANATVICGVTIGCHAFVGAGAVVARDVFDYALVVGTPARMVGVVCECGVRLPMTVDDGVEERACAACGKAYRRVAQRVTPIEP